MPPLLAMLLFFLISARHAEAASCAGGKLGWPLLPGTGPVASFTVSAPLGVSGSGWAVGQSRQTMPNGGQPRTTDDMATCVPVQVGLEDLGKAADSAAAQTIAALGQWTPTAGNNAHYDATVEEFVDCAQTSPGGGQTAGGAMVQHNCSAQGTGPHGEPVIQGPDGHNGYWQDIGSHQTAVVQSSGANSGSHLYSATLLVPAELLDVSAWLRVRARYWEGDSRLGAGPVSWTPGSGPAYCPSGTVMTQVYKHGHDTQECKSLKKKHGKHGDYYEYTMPSRTVRNSSGSFQADVSSAAFRVLVNPVALIQLKAVPYAIAYMPPGNQGKARLIDAVTEGTSYAVGTTHGSSNASGDVTGTCESTSMGFFEGLFGSGIGFSDSDLQCQSTTSTAGTTQGGSNVDTAYQNQSTGSGTEESDPDYAPGDYAKEAFWYDTFTIALNQPAAVYDDNGTSVTRFLPAKGYPAFGQMPVIELAACAYGRTIAGVDDVCKAGYSPQGKVDLTPDEAYAIVWLDPFFPVGQSIVPKSPGGRFAALSDLGGAGTLTCSAGSTCILQASNAQGLSGTSGFQAGTYTSVTVTNTNKDTSGWTLTLGAKVSGVGFGGSFGDSTSNIQGTTNSNGASVGYFASTAVSAGQSITFRVSPSDKTHDIVATTAAPSASCGGYPNPITVYPYQDSVFGGLLLRDPCAPKPWWWRTDIMLTRVAPLAQATHPQIPRAVRRAPIALSTDWAKDFAGDLDRAIATNPHLPQYIHSLPLRCRAPACLAARPRPVSSVKTKPISAPVANPIP